MSTTVDWTPRLLHGEGNGGEYEVRYLEVSRRWQWKAARLGDVRWCEQGYAATMEEAKAAAIAAAEPATPGAR